MFILNARRPTVIITWFLYWLTTSPPLVVTVILPSFSWDPRNECFKDSKDGASMHVDQESQLYIICPSVAITERVQTLITDQKNMYENMYMCTKDEFDKCEVGPERTAGKTRLVMTCDKPLDPQKLTYQSFSFQQFQSGEHGYAFEAGQTYYFIATSNGTKAGLENRKNGRCRENNMKLAIAICAQGENCHQKNKECIKDGSKEHSGAQKSSKGHDSAPSIKYMIIVGVGSFVVGVILCLIVITIYRKACRDGRLPSAYCCFNRHKGEIKVNQEPLC